MTISVKHTFASPKADGVDSTLVQPSNWNAEHTFTAAAGKVLGRNSSGAGAIQELPLAFDATGQSMIPPSGDTASRPATPAAGMFRYNTTTAKIELYTNSAWGAVAGSAIVSGTTPASPSTGDLWYNSTLGEFQTYNGSAWVTGAPANGSVTAAKVAEGSGSLRSIPQNAKTEAYTLIASDNGKHISITTGGVTVPASVFAIGDNITIYNNSSSSQTITQGGGVTMRQSGTSNTGNRTIAQYGLSTILCVSSNVFVITGAGVS